jgi:hypothetical protein
LRASWPWLTRFFLRTVRGTPRGVPAQAALPVLLGNFLPYRDCLLEVDARAWVRRHHVPDLRLHLSLLGPRETSAWIVT